MRAILEPRALVRLEVPEVTAVVVDVAAVAGQDAGDAVEHRRLPGAVGADQPERLALLQLERHAGQRVDAAEAHPDVCGLQQRSHQTFTTVGASAAITLGHLLRGDRLGELGNRGAGGNRLRKRSCQSGTTPCGVTITWRMRIAPTISGNASVDTGVCVSSSGPKIRKMPPTAAAPTERTPTTIAIATTASDCWNP